MEETPKVVVLSRASSDIGDYIGMESSVDLDQIDDHHGLSDSAVDDDRQDRWGRGGGKRDQRWTMMIKREKKEYPPPLRSLARTDKLSGNMLPWVMKRYYTTDGRLVIKEERVKHHEYFRAHRANGRLTLHLVHLHDDNDSEEEDDGVLADVPNDLDQQQGGDELTDSSTDNESSDEGCKMEGGDEERVVVGNWCSGSSKYNDNNKRGDSGNSNSGSGSSNVVRFVRSNSCVFDMPVPAAAAAARPVHI